MTKRRIVVEKSWFFAYFLNGLRQCHIWTIICTKMHLYLLGILFCEAFFPVIPHKSSENVCDFKRNIVSQRFSKLLKNVHVTGNKRFWYEYKKIVGHFFALEIDFVKFHKISHPSKSIKLQYQHLTLIYRLLLMSSYDVWSYYIFHWNNRKILFLWNTIFPKWTVKWSLNEIE